MSVTSAVPASGDSMAVLRLLKAARFQGRKQQERAQNSLYPTFLGPEGRRQRSLGWGISVS